MKLTIELVPTTCWYSNVRSNVSKKQWDIIRSRVYSKANNKCEICGSKGNKWAVECHEIWEYTKDYRQILRGFIALCPSCHEVKHYGLTKLRGRSHDAFRHLMKINGLNKNDTLIYLDDIYDEWAERSKYIWKLDITYLDNFLKED